MTENGLKNREAFIALAKDAWGFDEKSIAYIEKRTNDAEMELMPEYQAFYKAHNGEDLRVRLNLDLSNKTFQDFLERDDQAWRIFKETFIYALNKLSEDGVRVTYGDFLNNTVLFNKNKTKLKKVLEKVYEDNPAIYKKDTRGGSYKDPEEFINKKNEYIGTYKKSAKKIQVVVSFNPVDWLLASTAQDSLTSCLDLNKPNGDSGFQFCTGLPFLCGDVNRCMIYVCDGRTKEYEGIKTDYYLSRSWLVADKNGAYANVKWYPNKIFDAAAIAQLTGLNIYQFDECSNNFHGGRYPLVPLHLQNGVIISIYNDMGMWEFVDGQLYHTNSSAKGGQQVLSSRGTRKGDNGTFSFDHGWRQVLPVSVGIMSKVYKPKVWKRLGMKLSDLFPSARCTCCGKTYGGYFIRNNDRRGDECTDFAFVCSDCYVDKTETCCRCGTVNYLIDGKRTMKDILTVNGKRTYCRNCQEDLKRYTCSCCGIVDDSKQLRTTKGGKPICDDCLDTHRDGWGYCSSCSSIKQHVKAVFNTALNKTACVCRDCATPVLSDDEEKNVNGMSFSILTRLGVKNTLNLK